MTDNNNDPVVVEEDPVVDVDEGDNSSVGESKGVNVKLITIGVSVVISLLVYFFVFSSSKKEGDVVDNTAIVKEKNASTINTKPRIDNIDSIVDVGYNGDTFINQNISNELPSLPELPELPDTIGDNINEEIKNNRQEEIAKNGFSKEEVDMMISDKLRSFEEEMNKLKDESSRLAAELEQKKLEEEANKKKSKIPILNLTKGNGTNSEPENAEEAMQDMLTEMEEKKKEEERQLQIAQRRRVLEERKNSPMFKMQGGGGGDGTEEETSSIIVRSKDSLESIKTTEVKVTTARVSDLSRTVMQGKMINAVLETAINTGIKTQVRAIVSRDVYSELGKNIVIPKGSKIIGSFQTMSGNNVSRIQISWSRIIRVDGLSINISANSADSLGRGGINGELDNKYDIAIKNTFLSSLISIATAVLVDKVTNTVNTTTTTTGLNGTTYSSTSNATGKAVIDATEDLTDKVQDLADSASDATPVVLVPQGTKIIVVVGQDMVLPIYKQE